MTTQVSEVLDRLLQLAAHDDRLKRLEETLARAPAAAQVHEAAAAEVAGKIRLLAEKLAVLKAQVRLRENELKGHEQKVARLKQQSGEVRTNREFMAFRSEIANTQAEADRLAGEVLRILDVVNQAEARLAALSAERDRALEAAAEARRQEEEDQLERKAERDGLVRERPACSEGIPAEALELYERARQARGHGMAVLEGAYCSACGDLQTRNDVYAVQNRTRLVPCKGCNRILFLA